MGVGCLFGTYESFWNSVWSLWLCKEAVKWGSLRENRNCIVLGNVQMNVSFRIGSRANIFLIKHGVKPQGQGSGTTFNHLLITLKIGNFYSFWICHGGKRYLMPVNIQNIPLVSWRVQFKIINDIFHSYIAHKK